MNTQTLELPLLLPSGPECRRCVERLVSELGRIKGVAAADASSGDGAISVTFDPEIVTLSQIESEARLAGAGIAARIEHRTFDLKDLDCPDCAASIEKAVHQHPGVLWAGANFAAGQMHVEYERDKVSDADLIRIVEAHGARAIPLGSESESDSAASRQGSPLNKLWREHRKGVTTAACALLTLAAALLSASHLSAYATWLYAAAILTGGWSTARAAIMSLRAGALDMNVLMTVAVIGAAGIGEWFEGATVVALYSIGGLLQAYTVDRTRRSIRALMDLAPNVALVRREGRETPVPVEQVRVGEVVVVKPGGRIPMDGTLTAGTTTVNEAPITGESMPVVKEPGSRLFAGTLNGPASIELTVTHLYRDTTLARIIHRVEEAQAQRAPAQQLIDRFAARYTPAVVLLAALVAIVPPLALGGVWSEWLFRALSLLIIACPCALVISTPVAIVTAIGSASRAGALVKGGAFLEEVGRVRAVLYDKTGTLTRGKFAVEEIIPLNGTAVEEALRLAAAVESRSEHPLAQAFVEAAEAAGQKPPAAQELESMPGRGVWARIGSATYVVGNEALMAERGHNLKSLQPILQRAASSGRTPVLLASDARLLALFTVRDTPRPEAAEAVRDLRALGIREQVMLTGDSPAVAAGVAESVGLDDYRAGLLPEEKMALVREYAQTHGGVAMVGDGINDAPALAAASVGIAMGAAASDTALETADVALLGDDLSRLPYLVRLSRRARGVIIQNVATSLVTKGGLIAAALTVGIPLWLAVLGDVGVSLLVTANALRLLRVNA